MWHGLKPQRVFTKKLPSVKLCICAAVHNAWSCISYNIASKISWHFSLYKSICIVQLRAGLIGLMLYVVFHIYVLLALAQIQVTCMTYKTDDQSIIDYITISYKLCFVETV